MQALTDKLYKDYIKSLEDMGFEVITANELPDLEEFEGWGTLEGPRINQEQLKGSLMVIPEGFSYKVKKVSKNGKERTGGRGFKETGVLSPLAALKASSSMVNSETCSNTSTKSELRV